MSGCGALHPSTGESAMRVLDNRTHPSGRTICLILALAASSTLGLGEADGQEPRARDLGVPFEGRPGALNAITDVVGVEVGHVTLISGEGELVVGSGPVRTGVTAILPRGRDSVVPVFGGWSTLNGNGEMTGTTWVEESGLVEGPIMITNTLSVGVVHHAVIRWGVQRARESGESPGPYVAALPIVAETWDGSLNDIYGQHVTEEHAIRALDEARGGRVAEGNVGGGTGMICHGFKAGIGTASRVVTILEEEYTVGVLVQCNYGSRSLLQVAGVPVGQEIRDLMPARTPPADPPAVSNGPDQPGASETSQGREGSIIVVVATDAPLLSHQLKRIARRVSLSLGRMGSIASNGSGDIFIAFSTANVEAARGEDLETLSMLPNGSISGLFSATVFATEEAIVNALVAAETMTGRDGMQVFALPHDRLQKILRRYNRFGLDR
jgi:D-aminopeptidase